MMSKWDGNMMQRMLLSILLTALFVADDCKAEDSRLSGRHLDPIEGEWSLTGGGDIIIVEQGDRYVIEVLDSPDRSVIPGTVIGYAYETAVKGSYKATIFSILSGNSVDKSRDLILKLNDSEHLSFVEIKSGVKINPWRLLPYMFRGLIVPVNNRDDNLDGAVRRLPAGQRDREPRRYL